MTLANQYRRNAGLCLRYAREVEGDNRSIYLEIAQHWMDLAREAEEKAAAGDQESDLVALRRFH